LAADRHDRLRAEALGGAASVGSIGFDIHMKGPIFAATFRF
jgi:hypothetical protein